MNTDHPATQNQDESAIPLWTIQELARFLRCSERHVYILRRQGMPAIAVGGLVRFDPERVRHWLNTSGATALEAGELARRGGNFRCATKSACPEAPARPDFAR